MTREAADILLAAARDLRLRCFMGQLPFDVDQWMAQGMECDLPRLEDTDSWYHFEVRDIHDLGTFFKLRVGSEGKPYLTVGSFTEPGPYPANLDGWRAVVAEFERAVDTSPLAPRTYIWLHGHKASVRRAEAEDNPRFDEALRRLAGW